MAALVPISQHVLPIPNGNLVVTLVKLVSASDTVDVPSMSATDSGVHRAVQMRRPGDAAATVTQTDYNTATIVGTAGNECLIISHSDRPIVEAQEN